MTKITTQVSVNGSRHYDRKSSCRHGLCRQVRRHAQVPSSDFFSIPTELNNCPHPRGVRQHFYRDIATVLSKRVQRNNNSNSNNSNVVRLQASSIFPELNKSQDVYRIGTLMEMVRTITETIVADGLRVRLCVQGPLGEGVLAGMPLALSSARLILEGMDWTDMSLIDNTNNNAFIRFGTIGANDVRDDDDVFICIAPQSVVGGDVIPVLRDLCDAAGDSRAVILINPQLKDVPSADGIMGVRGRDERLKFMSSFERAYHFRLLYKKPFWYPIRGAIRYGQD